ncbi:AraC family transcriptional regulator [Mucilaginibacter sp.]|uniref:AraC family transcriptional regulator n=1 Tax=Mucilaginibacter sp. TaxID=1882438 RepID=UPI00260A1790|nr:AraC family transcriptional regulator [Mucilaginibacter sp.]MDB5126227.1 transcriptional regulator, AraC family [Mucilaginibacter sp.]
MKQLALDSKAIDILRDLPDMIPVFREFYESWNIRVFNRKHHECRNYLSPNRREFYKILLITKGSGVFTMGLNTYYIEEPTILFIHPNDIISWKNLTEESGGHYVLFKSSFINTHPQLKATIEKFGLFSNKDKKVLRLSENDTTILNQLFEIMEKEDISASDYREESLQAYLQLLMVESLKIGQYPKPDVVSEDFAHIYHFFDLLERETSNINYSNPIRLKTAKEFAADLAIHPNYLNAVLKKHTGQNVSTHIRNRLLEETKALLLQTDWTMQDIGFSIGFAEQPNFNSFFKKNTGFTPSEFRKAYHA